MFLACLCFGVFPGSDLLRRELGQQPDHGQRPLARGGHPFRAAVGQPAPRLRDRLRTRAFQLSAALASQGDPAFTLKCFTETELVLVIHLAYAPSC